MISRSWLPTACLALIGLCATVPSIAQSDGDSSDPVNQLSVMSLDELAKVQVMSVSKSEQSLATAPASIFVITREEILRTGVLSIPEALRLAPNMQVSQLTSADYSNGARGFAGAPDVQNFSNKILILIDGRTVYSPLFSGIAYDMQDVLMDDIDRIEIISGPGATLWGANAMNGVINIITRKSSETQGLLLRLDGGSEEQDAGLRFGGSLGEKGTFRVYAKYFDRGATEFADGTSADDDWSKTQVGFRTDFSSGQNALTVLGDYQHADQDFFETDDVSFWGANLLGRFEHAGDRVSTRVQMFVDRVDRERPPSGIAFDINTYDVEIQQSAQAGGRHHLTWGLGRRYYDYNTDNNELAFDPDHRTLNQTNVFLLDNLDFSDQWHLMAGVKLEDNSFSNWNVLPDLRLSYSPNDETLVWLAGSRAIRAPTPFDTEVQEFVGGDLFLAGNPDFKAEKVNAFELGYRTQLGSALSVNASVFYDKYEDLRTVEITPDTVFPLRWGNRMEGNAYGVEAWVNIQLAPWWRLSPGIRTLQKRLKFNADSSGLLGVAQAGNDPKARFTLNSSMNFGPFTLDALLREVGALPSPAVEEYTELSARFAWRVNEKLQLAVKGFNLLNETHREYAEPQGREIRRSVMAELRYNY
jgi:iron complex outermembrane receptor protein